MSRIPARLASVAALALYALLSVAIFGRGVLLSPHTHVVGDAGPDKTIAMWSLAWWPHALAAGRDPFDADVVWAPEGIDLAWVTSIPGASIAAWPLTALAGPVVSYNVLALAAPALSAWAAYALARELSGAPAPALLAGLLFGFSSYVVVHTVGHLNLTLAARAALRPARAAPLPRGSGAAPVRDPARARAHGPVPALGGALPDACPSGRALRGDRALAPARR
ncbi:MAG: hypothetical protein H0T39_08675 [Actinobacteria bacterium]|nr:hypothetical protein [Actinomycetota bacterium]